MRKHSLLAILCALVSSSAYHTSYAQEGMKYEEERASEDFSFLKDSVHLPWIDVIKCITIDANGNSYLSIGGSYRPRFEYFSNSNWVADNDESYYSQRLSFHADWHFGEHIRLFGELYHGYKTGGSTILQTDDVDWHQGFVEVYLPVDDYKLSLRLGRQEMKLGAGRLVDLRIGPNLRRSFDAGLLTFTTDRLAVDAFYGKEVQVGFDAFDNRFNIFSDDAVGPNLWGVYGQLLLSEKGDSQHKLDAYYVGFQSDRSAFSDVVGEEFRHSFGLRSFGLISKRFKFNTELIVQVGGIAGNSILAFNFETDWQYTYLQRRWHPTFGLKFDWSSGDRQVGDGMVHSFNPMFVNPSIYSLAAVNTPVNLLSLHPSFTFFPRQRWMVNIEAVAFFRSSSKDGVYAPPRFQSRSEGGIADKHIGNTIGAFIKYTCNRHVSFDLRTSYFIAGDFIQASGPSEPIFQCSPTLNLLF